MKQRNVEVITTVQLPARPATVLDHQYDQGHAFAKIAAFWPKDVAMPEIGVQSDSPVFLCLVKTASGGEQYAWPISSPEETMASALYFYLNAPSIFAGDTESLKKVAGELANAMTIYDLEMPRGYTDFCKQAARNMSAPLIEEVWAVDGLPVTTPSQTSVSCELFEDNEERWSQADRVVASTRLKTAALAHGQSWNHRYAIDDPMDVCISSDALIQLNKRADLAADVLSPKAPVYLRGLNKLASQIDAVRTMGDVVAMVGELERLDRFMHMDGEWGRTLREPAAAFLLESPENPLSDYDMAYQPAPTNWSDLDFEKLASYELVPASLMALLEADPATVAEQMPPEVQAILKDQFMLR